MTVNETPRYRVTADDGVWLHGGTRFLPGAEFVWRGWPALDWIRAVEPVNAPASAILAYAKERREGERLDSPFDVATAELFLPFRITHDPAASSATIIDEDRVEPGMPRYRCLRDAPPYLAEGPRRFAGRTIKAGEIITILEWPAALTKIPGEFEPADAVAKAAWAYYAANQGSTFIRPSPWCLARGGLFLPELPPPRLVREAETAQARGRRGDAR